MRIKTLYQDDNLTLQKLIIRIGDCQMIKYRQVMNIEELGLDVREVKELPLWYLRQMKLKQIGI